MKKLLCLALSAVVILCFAGCQKDMELSKKDSKAQGIDTMYVKDLEKPDEITYIVIDGDENEKTFSSSDEKFDKILELNANRDTLEIEGRKINFGTARYRGMFQLLTTDENNKLLNGKYLIYRYTDDRHGEVTFYLADSEDVKSGNYSWVTEDGNHGGPYGCLSDADDLVEYIESE